jgi:kynurenine formamidase
MMASPMRSFPFNKPFRILSHFTDGHGRSNLADFIKAPGVYAAGRRDVDSERPMVLTDDQIMLVINGIYLLENLKLDELVAKKVYEFALVVQPLKLRGFTGSTVAPTALR